MKRMKFVFSVLAIIGVGLISVIPAKGLADEPYPARPIQVIVPFPPGGVADLVARPFTTVLEKLVKQPVVVVNKTGAGGAVGMQAAAVSKPDGYTLMVALSSISVMPEVDALFGRPSTYKLKDFAPIALLTADPTIFVVKKESPWKTVADLVADAKKRPNEIKYSSSGVYGTMHVAMEMFTHAAGIKMRHIPTGGGGPALTSLLGGHVDALSGGPNVSIPHIKAGTLRVLANWGAKRLAALPDVPTMKELGYKDVEFYIWSGFFAPAATPPSAIKILREATAKAVQAPEFKAAMEKMDTPIYYLDSPEFQKFWDQDAERLIKAVRNIGKVQ
ncbi:MAG: tripartite tricarboxylate transporter substrate binding protein [Deltaproteobacteria bacterium]|nr:MAG: tripartite tricarboxylate transporter substrate binding protein [Deltaproteobacteria bacterium]RPJ39714.1 MAG: tripartite tricarboxylate transporter substrate binding protein [Deltaproteobacteria bacterium]